MRKMMQIHVARVMWSHGSSCNVARFICSCLDMSGQCMAKLCVVQRRQEITAAPLTSPLSLRRVEGEGVHGERTAAQSVLSPRWFGDETAKTQLNHADLGRLDRLFIFCEALPWVAVAVTTDLKPAMEDLLSQNESDHWQCHKLVEKWFLGTRWDSGTLPGQLY